MLFNCGVGEDPGGSLNCKIKPVNPKGNQSWMFIGRADTKAEALILWPPDARGDSFEKTLMLGKIKGRKRRVRQRTKMVGWHHWLNGHEFEHAPGVGYGQGILACCSPWGCKESDVTERLNWSDWTSLLINVFFDFHLDCLCVYYFHHYSITWNLDKRWTEDRLLFPLSEMLVS